MKRTFFVVLVVLVGFAATGCATGGYLGPRPYGGPLGDVMAGNLALTCPGDYFVGPPVNRCLRDVGGNMGQYSNYSMYRGGSGGPQLSQADKLSVFCGLGASGVAMLLDAGLKKILGAGLLSAAACEVAASVSNRGQGGQQIQTGGQPPVGQQPQSGLWGPGAPFGGRPSCLSQELVTLKNETGEILMVFVEGQYQRPVAVLQPRIPQCAQPGFRYEAQVLQTVVSSDGWVGGTDRAPVKPERRPGLVLVWR